MSIGYADYYRHQWLKDNKRAKQGEDVKPEMKEIIK